MIIALCHISAICPVEIEDVSEIVDGTLSKFLEVDGAHPVWPDGSGRFGQSDRILCVGRREKRRSCYWQLMELLFELSFGLIAGQTYWWWCELMGEFIGNHLGV